MGKMTSIYLTDDEASELKRYCEEHHCSQYSVLKNTLRAFLSNAKAEVVDETVTTQESEEEEAQDGEELQERKVDLPELIKRILDATKN